MKLIQIGLVSLSVLLVTGCASNSDVRAAKEEALQAAATADRTAQEALTEAREAKALAQEANSRSLRSEEMLNRGFKRSMYK